MTKSLRHANISVAEMAEYLDVSTRTVGNWINGHIEPSDRSARLWALRTGIPYTWFCHGSLDPCDYTPREVSAGEGFGATSRRRSNKMHYWTDGASA